MDGCTNNTISCRHSLLESFAMKAFPPLQVHQNSCRCPGRLCQNGKPPTSLHHEAMLKGCTSKNGFSAFDLIESLAEDSLCLPQIREMLCNHPRKLSSDERCPTGLMSSDKAENSFENTHVTSLWLNRFIRYGLFLVAVPAAALVCW